MAHKGALKEGKIAEIKLQQTTGLSNLNFDSNQKRGAFLVTDNACSVHGWPIKDKQCLIPEDKFSSGSQI